MSLTLLIVVLLPKELPAVLLAEPGAVVNVDPPLNVFCKDVRDSDSKGEEGLPEGLGEEEESKFTVLGREEEEEELEDPLDPPPPGEGGAGEPEENALKGLLK